MDFGQCLKPTRGYSYKVLMGERKPIKGNSRRKNSCERVRKQVAAREESLS